MEAVVDQKAPRQPRFVQPLQNAEITEGQRLVDYRIYKYINIVCVCVCVYTRFYYDYMLFFIHIPMCKCYLTWSDYSTNES